MKRIFLPLLLCGVPALLESARVNLPPCSRHVLSNGVVVNLIPRTDTPLIDIRAVIRGGAESDPGGMAGLASVVADLLRHGTATRTAQKFSEELDSMGATFEPVTDRQSTAISMEFLVRHSERALDLFSDAILRPGFPEPEVRRVLAQSSDYARSTKDSPGLAAALYFRAFMFGSEHPYSRPVGGDEITLRGIDRRAAIAYHRRMYVGKNLTLIVVGDFESAPMLERLKKQFETIRAGERYEWIEDRAPEPSASRVLLVDRPGAHATHFVIGRPGISRTNPDRVAASLVNAIFGGGFTSMLNSALRVDSGLTYGAQCVLDQNRLTGAISIRSDTATEYTGQAVALALSVMRALALHGISQQQLAAAKRYLKGNYLSEALDTADQVAVTVSERELYSLGFEDEAGLFDRIDAITLDEANAVVKKYFTTSGVFIILVGDAARIRNVALRYDAAPREIPITEPGYEIFQPMEPAGGVQVSSAAP